jgi:hypothetical protein
VEIKPLAEMLEDLLYESEDDEFSICLAEAPLVDPSEREAVCAEYRVRYGRAVAAVRSQRGDPAFEGDPRHEPSLGWIEGCEVSVWPDPAGELYVARVERFDSVSVVAGGRPLRHEPNAPTVLPPGD